ncbi:hypothetical protein [Kitasatospora viridis]|uniref:Uncharacterized protein n=1 Tax=Kitasatospora viridis TaxID=281105 RepID=A0A561TSK9_9ACTN|nr:hypothetical protein [Kitasatospora viridis]TWF90092.1 hypothetical protein FHX73_13136 [Kitasatospora viridis]
MSIGKKTATVLAVGSLLTLSGLAAAPTASAAAVGSAQPAPAVVTGAGGDQLASYDPATGQAVLTTGTAAPGQTASGSKPGGVKVGQVIDNPPTPAAPKGALLVVTAAQPAADGKQTVSTRPAAVNELLGDTTASVHTALAPASVQVDSQVPGLQVGYVPRIDGASGSSSMSLKLSADTDLDLPDGTSAAFSGSMSLEPSIDFDYTGTAFDLQHAHVGFQSDTEADWHVAGTFKAGTGTIKVPLASLKAAPVIWVGVVPVVVNVDLTLYADVSANGTVTVDTEQSYSDNWGVHSDYTKEDGWSSDSDQGSPELSPPAGSISGRGDIHTGLLTEGTVAIFDDLGVKADIEPYLRTVVSGSATFDDDGGLVNKKGSVKLYGGIDIGGALMARLRILSTTFFEKDLPFTVYHDEWPVPLSQD